MANRGAYPHRPALCVFWLRKVVDPNDGLTFGGNLIETGTGSSRRAAARARAEQQPLSWRARATPPAGACSVVSDSR